MISHVHTTLGNIDTIVSQQLRNIRSPTIVLYLIFQCTRNIERLRIFCRLCSRIRKVPHQIQPFRCCKCLVWSYPQSFEHALSNATVLSGVGRPCFLSLVTTDTTLAEEGGDASRHFVTSASTLLRLNDRPESQTARHIVPEFMIPRS